MEKYIKTYSTVDKVTGKPVDYRTFLKSSDAYRMCDELEKQGYISKKFKSYKHAWYSIYEGDNDIVVVYWGDGNDNYTRPY